jgi:hypothetical protein
MPIKPLMKNGKLTKFKQWTYPNWINSLNLLNIRIEDFLTMRTRLRRALALSKYYEAREIAKAKYEEKQLSKQELFNEGLEAVNGFADPAQF